MGFNVWYSDASGDALETPIVITGAEYDLVGTAAAFEWLVSQYGTLDADWRMLLKRAWGDEELFIDEYVIELPSGEERHHFFDLTESYLKWPD